MDKEEQTQQKKANKKKKKKINLTASIAISLILTAIVGFIVFFLNQGSTTTSGNYPDNVSDKSLVCSGEDIDYPFFTYDNANKKTIKINTVFSKDGLRSIALTYNLYYGDTQSITASEAHNHAAMNKSFGSNGLHADEYNANYSKLEDRMKMSLYATGSEINDTALKYFLIDTNSRSTPKTVTSYKTTYEEKGLKCEETK